MSAEGSAVPTLEQLQNALHMPVESAKVDARPTLEQLQNVLSSNKTEQLQHLRGRLGWSQAESADRVVPDQTTDSAYDRLRILVDNFGPSCLVCRNSKGNTLVHLTAKTCETEASMEHVYNYLGGEANLDSVDYLREKGAGGRTPTHFAAKNRSIAALKWLVRKLGSKCLKVKCDKGNTAVHVAAGHQGLDSMQFIMLELGASYFQKPGADGLNAFHCAARNLRSHEALNWLIDNIGPDLLTAKDSKGNTPVHLAARWQGKGCMELIKAALGDQMFSLDGENGELVVHSAAQSIKGNAALAWCIQAMGPECLLAEDALKRFPIHLAAQYQARGDMFMEMAMKALARGNLTVEIPGIEANELGPRWCLLVQDGAQRTAVHYAAMNETGNFALRWIVCQLGPDCLRVCDAQGVMPIHLAAWYQGVDSLRLIMDYLGAEAFQLAGESGWTMAHYAAENYSKTELLDWIVQEVGPQCLLVPAEDGTTSAKIAGLCD